MDLVEIAPTAEPPVCKLMDFGKFKYREAKKAHEAKLKQKQIQVKEVKFRPGTDEGDYQIKLRNLIKFLDEGDKTKVTLRFRGREMAHQEFGRRLIERVRNDLEATGWSSSTRRWKGASWSWCWGRRRWCPGEEEGGRDGEEGGRCERSERREADARKKSHAGSLAGHAGRPAGDSRTGWHRAVTCGTGPR